MAAITQHIPKFFEGYNPSVVEFTTQKELLAINFVYGFSVDYTNKPDPHFFQFSLNGNLLMVEFGEDGKNWAVVGHIDDTSELTLPKWVCKDEDNPEKCKGSFSIS